MFHTVQIERELFQITDVAGTHCFLVVGEQKAALLDTGAGCGSLHGQVCRLTDLPVEVFITHGHVDHAMGAGEFTEAWMNPLDEVIYREHSVKEVRLGYIQRNTQTPGTPYTGNALQPVKPFEEFHALSPGNSFDLGGITLEIHEGAGHTPGCVTILIPELHTLLLGDACNMGTFLFDERCSTVAEYRAMLLRLDRATRGRYDRALVCHGVSGLAPAGLLSGVIDVCDSVLQGTADAIPTQISLGGPSNIPAVIAKAIDMTTFSRLDGGCGNIIYNPAKIR